MKIIKVKSSWVDKIAYCSRNRELHILAKSGEFYSFGDIDSLTFINLIWAKSVGRAVSKFFKEGQKFYYIKRKRR